MAAHQAPPSLGFSRQEHWSGLPFPSPMHESEKWKVKVKSLSRVQLFATLWTAAYQAPPSMGFSRQEDWSGVPLPSPLLTILGGKYDCCCCCWVTKLCPTLETPWTVARQAPLSMGFPRQEYWNGLPFPSPGNWGIEPTSPALPADSLPLSHQGSW